MVWLLPAFLQATVILLLLKGRLDPVGLWRKTCYGVLVGQKCNKGEAPRDFAQSSLSLYVMNNAQSRADLSIQGSLIHRTQSTLS